MYPLPSAIQYLRRKHNERNQRRRENGDEPQCRENEGDGYRRHRRGDSRSLGYRGSNEIRFLVRTDYQERTMGEESAKKNRYGKRRNGRTNTDIEG